MLPADRAASTQAPRSFYIWQCDYNSAAPKDLDSLHPHVISTLRRMPANGKKVILRVHICRLDPNPNVDEI